MLTFKEEKQKHNNTNIRMANAHIKNGKCSHSTGGGGTHNNRNIRITNAHIQRKEHNNRKIRMANAHIQRKEKNIITGTYE